MKRVQCLGITASLALGACGNQSAITSTAPAQLPGEVATNPVDVMPAVAPGLANAANAPAANAANAANAVAAPAMQTAVPAAPTGQAGAAAPITPVDPANAMSTAPAMQTAVAPPPTASLTILAPQVQPGAEDTQCVQIKLSTTEPVDIVNLHNTLSPGSHHFIVTALNDAAAPEQPLKRCQGFGGAVTGAPLSITQAHDDHVQLPEGIGYRLNAGHVIHLEMHYINTTDKPLDISATTNMFAGAKGAALKPAAVMLIGTADISVPPHATAETGPKFLKLPAGMEDTKFFQITGHTHMHGTNVQVSLASALQQPMMDLYAPVNFDWEAPESKALMPHVSVPQGGGFLLNCAWNNTTDTELKWGESALTEMCFFWGYYYPRKEVFSIVIDDIDQELLKQIAGRPPEDPAMPQP